MPELVMLDPSLLLSSRTFPIVQSAWRLGELEGALFPTSFATAMRERNISERALQFFGARTLMPDLADVRRFLLEASPIELDQSRASSWADIAFAQRLKAKVRDPIVFGTLLDEWTFLTSKSWVASRVRRPFSAFIRAGGVAIEWGGRNFDRVAARVLRIPRQEMPRPLTRGQRLRAVTKWIAAGGSSALPLVDPISAVIGSVAIGYFVLFDP